jgi:hypothetical protein
MMINSDTKALEDLIKNNIGIQREIQEGLVLLKSRLRSLELHWKDEAYHTFREQFYTQTTVIARRLDQWGDIDLKLLSLIQQLEDISYTQQVHQENTHSSHQIHAQEIDHDANDSKSISTKPQPSYIPLDGEVFFCGHCSRQIPANDETRCPCGSRTVSWYKHEGSDEAMRKWTQLNPTFETKL